MNNPADPSASHDEIPTPIDLPEDFGKAPFYCPNLDNAFLWAENQTLKNELIRLSAEREKEREDGVRSVLLIRCTKHLTIAQQNTNEITGAECGGCIAQERDTWKELADLKDAKGEANRTENNKLRGENNRLRATLTERDRDLEEARVWFDLGRLTVAIAHGKALVGSAKELDDNPVNCISVIVNRLATSERQRKEMEGRAVALCEDLIGMVEEYHSCEWGDNEPFTPDFVELDKRLQSLRSTTEQPES